MQKVSYLFLIGFTLIFYSCGDTALDTPTILINKEILAKSKALYNLNRSEQTEDALMNEKGEWVIAWQGKNIHNIQNNGKAFQADQMLLLKKEAWELIELDEDLAISQLFSFQEKSYMIGRKNSQSFVLDSLAQPIKLLPAFVSSMECSANYCQYNSEKGNVFVDKDFNIVWKNKSWTRIQQHPKADHIISYEKSQNYDISYKLVNLQTGDSISTASLEIDNPLSQFRRLIPTYLEKGLEFFPMIVNSSEELARYEKMMTKDAGSRDRIANDSIKIQLFNWDFEPISPQIYPGRYFTGRTTPYAQYGQVWKRNYSIILFGPKLQLLNNLDYAYPVDDKNWAGIRDKQNIYHVFFKGQLLKSFPKASIEVLNDQYISVSQNGINTVYDSTGTPVLSPSEHKFQAVSEQDSYQEKSVEYIAERKKKQISLIHIKSKTRYQVSVPEEKKHYYVKYLGADFWTIVNYTLIKGERILDQAEFTYSKRNLIRFERLGNSLFLAKSKVHYYKEDEQRFTTDDIIRVLNLEGKKIMGYDFFYSFSSFKDYKAYELLKLVPHSLGGDPYDASAAAYFNYKGKKIWPEHLRNIKRAPNIKNRENLSRFIEDNDCDVGEWKGEISLEEVLAPLGLSNYERWSFEVIHFNANSYRQTSVYNQAGDELLEGLYWKHLSSFKSGDFLVINAIEMSTGQTKKGVKPIYFKIP